MIKNKAKRILISIIFRLHRSYHLFPVLDYVKLYTTSHHYPINALGQKEIETLLHFLLTLNYHLIMSVSVCLSCDTKAMDCMA